MGENDVRAMPSAPATPEPSPAVSALRGGIGIAAMQADREAAAAYYYSAGGSPHVANAIKRGEKDEWFRVKAFARHRTQAQESLIEALQWALDELNGRTRYDEDVADQQIENCYARAEAALSLARGAA